MLGNPLGEKILPELAILPVSVDVAMDQGKATTTHVYPQRFALPEGSAMCWSGRSCLPLVPQQWGTLLGSAHNCPCIFGAWGFSAEAEISRLSVGPRGQKIAEDLVAASFQDVQE